MLTEFLGWCLELPILRSETFYIARPLYYTGGLVLAAATLLVGGTVVCPTEHTPEVLWNACVAGHVTFAFLIPDQLVALIEAAQAQGSLPSAPATVLTMGGAIAPETKQAVKSVLGAKYIESWGNSEGLGTITSPEDVTERPLSIGRPFLTDKMIVLDEDNREVEPGVVGRLAAVTDSRLVEYRNRDDLNRALIKDDLVISEDLGFRDAQGYYYLRGRTTERFLRRGHPIYASDIQQVLLALPGIRAACVMGIPDADEGEVPVAAVEATAESREAELLVGCNQLLPAIHQLRALRIVAMLPRTHTGKVNTAAVRQIFQA